MCNIEYLCSSTPVLSRVDSSEMKSFFEKYNCGLTYTDNVDELVELELCDELLEIEDSDIDELLELVELNDWLELDWLDKLLELVKKYDFAIS